MYWFIYFHNFFPPLVLSHACYLNFSLYLLQNLPFSTGTFWMQCPLSSGIFSLFSSSVLSWITPSLLSPCIFCTAFFLFSLINFLSCTVFPCCYLRLFPPLLEAGFGVLVETIWQWTVPSSNMSQMAPNTSVVGIPWDWGMETYRTAAATAGERIEQSLQQCRFKQWNNEDRAVNVERKLMARQSIQFHQEKNFKYLLVHALYMSGLTTFLIINDSKRVAGLWTEDVTLGSEKLCWAFLTIIYILVNYWPIDCENNQQINR